ncbi:hypothetical protein Q3G72_015664 [Acer saccharum]|nr:hypothetical protein Q3G72_015664 [Acer saccharum]
MKKRYQEMEDEVAGFQELENEAAALRDMQANPIDFCGLPLLRQANSIAAFGASAIIASIIAFGASPSFGVSSSTSSFIFPAIGQSNYVHELLLYQVLLLIHQPLNNQVRLYLVQLSLLVVFFVQQAPLPLGHHHSVFLVDHFLASVRRLQVLLLFLASVRQLLFYQVTYQTLNMDNQVPLHSQFLLLDKLIESCYVIYR